MKDSKLILTYRNRYPLIPSRNVKVPKEIEVAVFLIRHELKSRMAFEALNRIATIDCYLESHLDSLILAILKMCDGKDETYATYADLMDKWAKDINTDPDVITRRALKIYNSLVKARDKHNESKV